MSILQFMRALRFRAQEAFIVFVVVLLTAALVTSLQSKMYKATAQIIFDIDDVDPVTGIPRPAVVLSNYMATQVDLLQSGRVAQNVINELRLESDSVLQQEWMARARNGEAFSVWLAAELRRNLSTKQTRESNVLSLSYVSKDPASAARLANAFTQSYIAVGKELKSDSAKKYSSFFEQRTRQAYLAVEAAQQKLSEYQAKNGLISTDDRYDIEATRLQQLNSQLIVLQSAAAESQGRYSQATVSTDSLNEILNSPLIAPLSAELSRQGAKIQELSSRLGDAHPQVLEAKAGAAELRRRISNESARIARGIGTDSQVISSRVAQAQNALTEQRIKVLKLKQQREESAALEREVNAARSSFQALSQRMDQTDLTSKAIQTNVSVLENATTPLRAESPKWTVNLGLAAFVGAIFAFMTVFFRELADRRLRNVSDIIGAVDAPVLGTLPVAVATKGNRDRRPVLLARRHAALSGPK